DTTPPARTPSETSESARQVGSCRVGLQPTGLTRGGAGRCRLWRALVRAGAPRSHPATLSSRRSAPPLCGHAWAVTAAHEPAYQPSRHPHRQSGLAAEPSRGAQSRAAALTVSGELPRFLSDLADNKAQPCHI